MTYNDAFDLFIHIAVVPSCCRHLPAQIRRVQVEANVSLVVYPIAIPFRIDPHVKGFASVGHPNNDRWFSVGKVAYTIQVVTDGSCIGGWANTLFMPERSAFNKKENPFVAIGKRKAVECAFVTICLMRDHSFQSLTFPQAGEAKCRWQFVEDVASFTWL